MKLKKILLASATVAAFSAVMSISALAANYDLTGSITYTPADGATPAYVTVANAPEFTDGSSYTMLILNTNNGATLTTIANTDIKQIGEEPVTYKNVKIPVGDLTEDATYEVRMGGNGELWTGTFKVPKAVDDNPYADSTRLLGDVTGEGEINITDVSNIANAVAKVATLGGEVLEAADANDDGSLNISDVSAVANHVAKVDLSTVNGKKTVAEKSNYLTLVTEETN